MQVYVQGIVFTCKNYGALQARVHSPIQTACSSRSSRRRPLCSYLHAAPAPQRSLPEHQPKVSGRKKLPIACYPIFFFHHFVWKRWFASLATTVDNTIKMAERSFKHGRQWCIRRISAQQWWPLREGRDGKCEGRNEKCEYLARESENSSPIVRIFWQGKCKFIANFSAAMVTSLPSHSLPSLSLSLSLSHRKYLTHNIGSASALPIIQFSTLSFPNRIEYSVC